MVATPEEFFADDPVGLAVHRRVLALLDEPVEVRVSKSQVALRARTGFAWLWRPSTYVRTDVPVVLSLALPAPVESPRWKEVVHPAPHTWMHHLEVREVAEVDDEVAGWLHAARDAAG